MRYHRLWLRTRRLLRTRHLLRSRRLLRTRASSHAATQLSDPLRVRQLIQMLPNDSAAR